jgi:hypothetical protein
MRTVSRAARSVAQHRGLGRAATISGTVTVEGTGAPAWGIWVIVSDHWVGVPGSPVKTDASGSYAISIDTNTTAAVRVQFKDCRPDGMRPSRRASR